MDCTSPSMLIGANWATGSAAQTPPALPELSLEAAAATLGSVESNQTRPGAVSHLDHTREGSRNVFKFGGTSVGSPARLCGLVRIVREERERVVAVVVSAMGHTTDHLLEAVDFAAKGDAERALAVVDAIQQLSIDNAHETQRLVAAELHPDAVISVEDMTSEVVAFFKPLRELLYGISLLQEKTAAALDTVLSFGERMSASIVARLLTAAGVKAFFLDAREWLTTDATYGCAVVSFDESKQKLQALAEDWEMRGLPVITGFIGRARSELGGRTTTLGRNGSDYTATIVGAALGADYVVINTDISGVMTADPRIVERAVALSHLNHHEALELAVYGTRMFHARTMVPLIKAGVTMLIRNTMDPNGHGTYISSVDRTGRPETCTTSLENLTMLEMRTRIIQDASLQGASAGAVSENIGARITKVLESRRIPVWLSIRGAHGQAINVVIPRDCEEIARDAIQEELASEMESHEVDPLNVQSPVTMLSIVAEDFALVPYNQTKFFGALADAGIPVLAVGQGTSSRSLSCVIRGQDTKVAVRRVHDAFNVDHVDVSIVLLGCNHITHEVIAQLQQQQNLYLQQHKARVKVVGFGSNCCRFEFNARGFTFEELLARVESCDKRAPLEHNSDAYAGAPTISQLDALQDLPIPMLVDCSGQSSTKNLYDACLERGIHVVVSNARSVCNLPPTASRESVAAKARTTGRAFLMYTSTIGASLPVIDTLGNIMRTGDRVLRIETALSGSMGFVTNQIMRGVPLSEAVREALVRGYCERDPREDLAGTDVAAKIVVLARALGVRLDTRLIKVEPLVPHEVLAGLQWSGVEGDAESLCETLKAHDDAFRSKFYTPAIEQGKRLHYVASIDLTRFPAIQAEVKPALIDESHPAFYARDNEISFGFSTQQYQPNPLVLKGSGTGASASATGVLRDVVTILYTLQGKNLHV